MKHQVKVIFFDAAGTLIRPARPIGETYAMAAQNYGQNWDGAALNQSFRHVFKKISGPDNSPREGDHRAWWQKAVRETIERVNPIPKHFPFDAYFDELYSLFCRADMWRIYPEVEEVLTTLQKHRFRLAILSNWDQRLHLTLKDLELDHHFEARLVSADLGAEKPQPDIYSRALEKLKVSADQALMVGDEPMNDYWAPRSHGWHAVLVERPTQDLRAVLDWLSIK